MLKDALRPASTYHPEVHFKGEIPDEPLAADVQLPDEDLNDRTLGYAAPPEHTQQKDSDEAEANRWLQIHR